MKQNRRSDTVLTGAGDDIDPRSVRETLFGHHTADIRDVVERVRDSVDGSDRDVLFGPRNERRQEFGRARIGFDVKDVDPGSTPAVDGDPADASRCGRPVVAGRSTAPPSGRVGCPCRVRSYLCFSRVRCSFLDHDRLSDATPHLPRRLLLV